jgi:hypothetical protein
VDDARRSIINILARNKDIFDKTRDMFNAEELSNPLYVRLMNIISEMYDEGKPIVQADLISRFDNTDEQNAVIDIFILKTDFSDRDDLQKAVNDQMRVVKLSYYDELLKNETAKPDRNDSVILKYLKKKNESIKFNIKI